MSMPKATMYEDHGASSRKHNVRLAREIPHVQAKSVPPSMQRAAQQDLRLRVASTNARHHPASRGAVDYVDHQANNGRLYGTPSRARATRDWT